MAQNTLADVRPSPIAGTWYPGSSHALAALVDGFLDAAQPDIPAGRIVGVLAPHAGLRYSGPVAAYAFAALRGLRPDVVAVLSPSHYPYPAPLLTSAHAAYETPLGEVPVDSNLQTALAKGVALAGVRHDPEHSLEIELPFLQRVFPEGFRLLPLMLIDQSPDTTERLGHALASVIRDQNAVIVASSDLSHFYPQNVAERLDAAMLERVEAFDPAGVLAVEEQEKGFACGRGAIAAVLWAAKDLGADTARILHYATSGATSGDYQRVVGYGAGVFFQAESG